MASSLINRLQRIRNMTQAEKPVTASHVPNNTTEHPSGFEDEWIPAGYKVLKRTIISNIIFVLSPVLPEEIKILVPDFLKFHKKIISPEDLVFFDLETTGLSGGAGTAAFLAALGFFIPAAEPRKYLLQIDQYLLLDYPGEPDFLESVIPFLHDTNKTIASYNGKTFDTKLFRTRCLMNGIKPPEYHETDLLHPARRLWKRILPNCSQAEIEVSILGLDRNGDISGAFAPQIWFDFLNSQNPSDLLAICDHNRKDIEGLASLFTLMAEISAKPLDVLLKHLFDIEAAALRWRDFSRCFPDNLVLKKQTETLMAFCVERKHPRCMYFHGYDLMKKGFHDEGLSVLHELSEMEIPSSLRAAVLNNMVIDAEWRLKDCIQALNYTDDLLQIECLTESFRNKLHQRRERLLKKLSF